MKVPSVPQLYLGMAVVGTALLVEIAVFAALFMDWRPVAITSLY